MKAQQKKLDKEIEAGRKKPRKGYYTSNVLDILLTLYKDPDFIRPKGKDQRVWNKWELANLVHYFFYKPDNTNIKELSEKVDK